MLGVVINTAESFPLPFLFLLITCDPEIRRERGGTRGSMVANFSTPGSFKGGKGNFRCPSVGVEVTFTPMGEKNPANTRSSLCGDKRKLFFHLVSRGKPKMLLLLASKRKSERAEIFFTTWTTK